MMEPWENGFVTRYERKSTRGSVFQYSNIPGFQYSIIPFGF